MHLRRLSLLSALALLATTAYSQQTAPATPATTTAAPDDEVVQMSTFSVSTGKDNGYIAADTLSGSRLSTNLLKTPADITVLTRQFLDDIGANNLNEAAVWLTNSSVIPPTERDFGGNVSFRGLPSGGTTRDYFAYPTSVDDYVVERMEGARGANSILYGDGFSGGQVNTIIKRAEFRNFVKVGGRYDTEGSWRANLDANYRVNRQLALRVNAMDMERRTWQEAFFDDRYGAQITATYRPWKGADFRVEGEMSRAKTSRMSTTEAFMDGASLWDTTTIIDGPISSTPTGSGITRYTADTLVFSPSLGGIVNLKNFARSSGTFLRIFDKTQEREALPDAIEARYPVIPRRGFRVRPTEAWLDTHTKTASLYYNQSFDSGFVFEIAGQATALNIEGINEEWSTAYIDIIRTLPDGTPNPNFKKYYSERTIQSQGKSPRTVETLRIAAAYPWKTKYFTQTFSTVAQRRIGFNGTDTYRFSRLNGPNPDARSDENMVLFRQYWDQPGVSPLISLLTNQNDPNYGWVMSNNSDLHNTLDSIQLNTVGSYFKDKLNLVAGIRNDDYKFSSRNIGTYTTGGAPDTYSTFSKEVRTTTSSIGGTLFPIPQVGVFANYAQAFAPNTLAVPDIHGVYSVATTLSDSQSLGFRLNFFKGKLVGSVGYYQSHEKNRPKSINAGFVNNIWRYLNKPDMQIGGGAYSSYIDTFNYEAYGYEIDLVANPTKHLRILFNLAFPRTEQNDSFAESKAYYATHVAEWQAGALNTANPRATDINSNLSSYQNELFTAVDGRPVNMTYNYRANLFANYEFTHGWLRGFRLGGGANVFGARMIGSPTNAPYDLMYADTYATGTLTLAYYRKFKRVSMYAQVSITNLFDYSKPVFEGIQTYNSVGYRSAYQYVEPRKASFSISLTY